MQISFAPTGSHPLGASVRGLRPGLDAVLARLFAQKLSDSLGQQVVVDNRPGAGGNLSAEMTARSAPDGYTIYICAPSLVVYAALYTKIAYDPDHDFAPVTLCASVQKALVVGP